MFYFETLGNMMMSCCFLFVFDVGVLLFVVGMIINIHSDFILRNLRKPGETIYRIPHGTTDSATHQILTRNGS